MGFLSECCHRGPPILFSLVPLLLSDPGPSTKWSDFPLNSSPYGRVTYVPPPFFPYGQVTSLNLGLYLLKSQSIFVEPTVFSLTCLNLKL